MMNCELLVIGGSAGSLDVLIKCIPRLTKKLPFAIVIVLHRKNDINSSLPRLFKMKCRADLCIKEAEDKEVIQPDTIYIAPTDYHLLIEKNQTFSLDHSEKIHFCRPSIDATFETAADAYSQNLVSVLLSGSNADGVNGLRIVNISGGLTVAQDPLTCPVPYMT